jgi:hypothetical protein
LVAVSRERGFSPAVADCGYRAPLAPRLARPQKGYHGIAVDGATTDDRRLTTDDRRPTTDDRRPTTDDRRPTTEQSVDEGLP